VITAIGVFLMGVNKTLYNTSIKKYWVVEYVRNIGRLLQTSWPTVRIFN